MGSGHSPHPHQMLSREEKKRAIARVKADGAIKLFDLALQVQMPPVLLERYIARGKKGIHLDGIVIADPKTGERHWFSSVQAWERFQKLALREPTSPA